MCCLLAPSQCCSNPTCSLRHVRRWRRSISAWVDCSTSLLHMKQLAGVPRAARVIVVGLHCCGDLSPAMLRLFARGGPSDGMAAVVNLGCCYHRLSESHPDPTGIAPQRLPPAEAAARAPGATAAPAQTASRAAGAIGGGSVGFPMSSFLRHGAGDSLSAQQCAAPRLLLGRKALDLACHSIVLQRHQQPQPTQPSSAQKLERVAGLVRVCCHRQMSPTAGCGAHAISLVLWGVGCPFVFASEDEVNALPKRLRRLLYRAALQLVRALRWLLHAASQPRFVSEEGCRWNRSSCRCSSDTSRRRCILPR